MRRGLLPRVVWPSLLARQRELREAKLPLALLWHLFSPLFVAWPVAHPCCLHLGTCMFATTSLSWATSTRCSTAVVQSPWDLHQVWLCQHFTEVCTQLVFHPCQEVSSHHPWNWVQVHLLWRLFRLPRQISQRCVTVVSRARWHQ